MDAVIVVVAAVALLVLLVWWLRGQHPERASSHLEDVADEWTSRRERPYAEAGAEAMTPEELGDSARSVSARRPHRPAARRRDDPRPD